MKELITSIYFYNNDKYVANNAINNKCCNQKNQKKYIEWRKYSFFQFYCLSFYVFLFVPYIYNIFVDAIV